MLLIEIDALSRTFGNLRAPKSVSFDLRQGRILGFPGPNGAGNLAPSGGSVRICGIDPAEEPVAAKNPGLHPDKMEVHKPIIYKAGGNKIIACAAPGPPRHPRHRLAPSRRRRDLTLKFTLGGSIASDTLWATRPERGYGRHL